MRLLSLISLGKLKKERKLTRFSFFEWQDVKGKGIVNFMKKICINRRFSADRTKNNHKSILKSYVLLFSI